MFTGIIRAIAPLSKMDRKKSYLRYGISFPSELLEGLEKGASVSIDGVCQTVVDFSEDLVWFEAIEETLSKTTFKDMKINDLVNIERSAKIGDEIGGHLLSGHIFGTATITKIEENIYTFQVPQKAWMKYLFSKGFIGIDGMSLTVVDVWRDKREFTVHFIPETLKRTTLGRKKVGDLVNIEFDALTQAAVETIERVIQVKKTKKYDLYNKRHNIFLL